VNQNLRDVIRRSASKRTRMELKNRWRHVAARRWPRGRGCSADLKSKCRRRTHVPPQSFHHRRSIYQCHRRDSHHWATNGIRYTLMHVPATNSPLYVGPLTSRIRAICRRAPCHGSRPRVAAETFTLLRRISRSSPLRCPSVLSKLLPGDWRGQPHAASCASLMWPATGRRAARPAQFDGRARSSSVATLRSLSQNLPGRRNR